MNIRFFEVNKINEPLGLEEYVKSFRVRNEYGPATLSELLIDAFHSKDKDITAAAWIWILFLISQENNSSLGEIRKNQKRTIWKAVWLVQEIFRYFEEEGVILEHFKDIVQTCRPIFTKIDNTTKSAIFAVDRFMKEQLSTLKYVSMAKLLEEETTKIKLMTDAYYAFAFSED